MVGVLCEGVGLHCASNLLVVTYGTVLCCVVPVWVGMGWAAGWFGGALLR